MEKARIESHHESQRSKREHLGLELFLQRPDERSVRQLRQMQDVDGDALVPEVDADGDHVHFEMVPMDGESLLWLTIRREATPEVAAASLRKIADLIDRHGNKLLKLLQGKQGSFRANGDILAGPIRLGYDENGDLEVPVDMAE